MKICQTADWDYGCLYGDIMPKQRYSSTVLVRRKFSLNCTPFAQTRTWV